MKGTPFILLLMIFFVSYSSRAQQQTANLYQKPLQTVLDDIEKKYHVKLVYEDKNVKDKTVSFADWKFFLDVGETLDNVLKPLELRYNQTGEKLYEIAKWEYFRKPFDEGRKHLAALSGSYPTLEKWEARKEAVRKNILKKLGLSPLPRLTPLNPIKSNFRTHNGYTVENIALEVLPGVFLSGSLYKPSKGKGPFPAMLSPHGHFYNKTDTSIPNERGRYRPDQQYRCAMLARMGIIVFSYDMFAWGESTLQTAKEDHRTGLALTMQTWNSMRVLDFLTSLPEVDATRIGITGASGGGTQTFLAAALDGRITLSVPTVMVSSHFFGGCPCESGLPIHQMEDGMQTNNAEIAALFAPYPQLIISDGNDWTQTVPEIEFPYLKKIYCLYGKPENIENVHLANEQHDYGSSKRFAMYRFVARQFNLDDSPLRNSTGEYDESKVTIEPAKEMYVFGEGGHLPANAVKGAEAIRLVLTQSR
jgi:dienelactone hydrolase